MNKRRIFLVATISLLTFSCQQKTKQVSDESTEKPAEKKELRPIEIETLRSELGMDGKEEDGQFKITVPQNDLSVMVDGFRIVPPMGLGSWVAFAPTSGGPMIMGDIVVTEKDLKPVQEEIVKH